MSRSLGESKSGLEVWRTIFQNTFLMVGRVCHRGEGRQIFLFGVVAPQRHRRYLGAHSWGGVAHPDPPWNTLGGAYAPPDPPLNGFAKESSWQFHVGWHDFTWGYMILPWSAMSKFGFVMSKCGLFMSNFEFVMSKSGLDMSNFGLLCQMLDFYVKFWIF